MKTKFNLIFKDPNYIDWEITLHTSEPRTEEEILNLIEIWSDFCNTYLDDYSPVDIMDRLVDYMQDDGRDWDWTDMDYDAIEITDW